MSKRRGAVCHLVEQGSSAVSCPCCGQENSCGVVDLTDLTVPCWCRAVTIPPVLLARARIVSGTTACICRSCVGEETRKAIRQATSDTHATWPTLAMIVASRLSRMRRDR